MTSSILIAGDRSEVAQALGDFLRGEGFETIVASAASEVLRAASAGRPDVALIDLDLPVPGALDVAQAVRQASGRPALPLVLVRREGSDGSDKVDALDLGADDVLVEPYDRRELLARLRALVRRGGAPRRRLVAGDLELDVGEHRVSVSGREVALTSKEFDLLRYLLEGSGRAVPREELLEQVWRYGGAAEIESRTLDVHVRGLRRKLGAEGSRIVTVRGVGYRFEPPGAD